MVSDVRPLIIQSSPADEDRLRLDREARALQGVLAALKLDPNTITILHAATEADIVDALNRRPYSIVQFSGHGHPGGIFVESGQSDHGAMVNIDEVERILADALPGLSVLILMSCHSAEMAQRLIKLVPVVITIKGAGDDEACVRFVAKLYEFLFDGHGLDWAYSCASRSVSPQLETLLLRRAQVEPASRFLIRADCHRGGAVYVDVSAVAEDITRLGLDDGEFYSMIAHKMRFHEWVFRYPRSNVLLPVGGIVGRFSWHDAEDRVFCQALYKVSPDCPDEVCSAWLYLLIVYHDLYIADYRSPNWRDSRRADEKVFEGLHNLGNFQRRFMSTDGEFSTIRHHVKCDLKASLSLYTASMRVAEEKYKSRDLGGCVQHMEAALSSLHDSLEMIGKEILL